MTDAAEHLVVPRLVERLRTEAPEVTIEVTNRGDDVEDALRRGEVDLLVGFDLRPVDGLLTQNLRADHFVVASTGKRAPTLEAYAAAPHVLVAPRGGPGGVVDRALDKVGHKRFVALRTSSFAAALGAVRGPLVLTLPRSFAEAIGVPEGVRLHAPPLELPALSLRAVSAMANRDDPTSQWLRGLVREVVGRG